MLKKTGILLAALALVIAGAGAFLARRHATTVPVLWRAPEFTLTDQRGSPFASSELNGTVWIASFIYTSCPDVCPLITARMAQIRDALAAEEVLGTGARLVSFTVDPQRDSPAVLRAYAERYGGADPGRWAFLTGPPQAMRDIVTDGFRLGAQITPAAGVVTQPTPPAPATGRETPAPAAGVTPAPAAGDDAASTHTAHGAGQPAGARHAAGEATHDPYLVIHSPRLVLVDGDRKSVV